jgi:hypothetical protein
MLQEDTKGIPNLSIAVHCLSTVYSKSNTAVPVLVSEN